jgi:hypothetical protein
METSNLEADKKPYQSLNLAQVVHNGSIAITGKPTADQEQSQCGCSKHLRHGPNSYIGLEAVEETVTIHVTVNTDRWPARKTISFPWKLCQTWEVSISWVLSQNVCH